MEIIYEVDLDVARENNKLQAIIAKQGDVDSRFIRARILDNDVFLPVPSTCSVVINGKRADGQCGTYAGTVEEDGRVKVPLKAWYLALDQIVRCDISISNTDGQLLSTMSFTISVQSSNSGSISPIDPDYITISDLIVEVNALKTACTTAAELATTKAGLADAAATSANNAAAEAREISNFYGSPLTAPTAASMTQTNRVYVYTGSESGYTTGNWYYYNGSAWVSGGTYNSATVDGIIFHDETESVDYLVKFKVIGGKPYLAYEEI